MDGSQTNIVTTDSYQIDESIESEVKVWDIQQAYVLHKLQIPGRVDWISLYTKYEEVEEVEEGQEPGKEEFMLLALYDVEESITKY